MSAIDITAARLLKEEAFRQYPYNDATGQRVSCLPAGNLSWLIGLNLETAGSMDLAEVVTEFLLRKLNASLASFWWYAKLDDVRLSVVLDVAFNAGAAGLLHFPKMLAAIGSQDWATAKTELLDSAAARELPKRYAVLAQIMLTGMP